MTHKIAAVWWLYELQSWLVIIDDRHSFHIPRLSTITAGYTHALLHVSLAPCAHDCVRVGSHLKNSFYLFNSNGHFFSMFHLKRILRFSLSLSLIFVAMPICFVFIRTLLPIQKRTLAQTPTRKITIVEHLVSTTLTRLQRCAQRWSKVFFFFRIFIYFLHF